VTDGRQRRTTFAGAAAVLVASVVTSVVPLRAQCPDGTPPPCGARSAPPPTSIAVLTFENVTRDTSAQYLAEGLADQIFTRLGGVERLTMISRTAVRRLHSPEQLSVQQIGRSLNASYLVSGSIRVAGGRVRVNVEALQAATGEAVWSSAYDRTGDDLIGLEEDIATEVAAGVAGRLSPQERSALGSRVTASSRAYEQFLRGNVLMARRSAAAQRDAIAAYQAATEADPTFADAFGRLAYAYALCHLWTCRTDRDSLFGLSREASTRALRLNPRSSDAWMGRAYLLTQWARGASSRGNDSLLASLAAFKRAVDLNPRNDEAWHQYGSTLSQVNDSASIAALRRALALDPARAITYQDLSLTYYITGDNGRALAIIDSAVALDPDGPFRGVRAVYRLTIGDTAGAVADARLAPTVMLAPAILAVMAHDSAAAGAMEAPLARTGCDALGASYLQWTRRHEQAVQRLLACGPSLLVRWWLRFPILMPLAGDPRLQALRAETDSIVARAPWR
jgi:TolB-like protein/tetratricopeptide (TPR) repeat protein